MLNQDSYFVIQQLAEDESDVVRYAALLRGTESAWQAISYGLESVKVFAHVGGVYMNFGLWAVAIAPAWLVLRHYGASESHVEEEDIQGAGQTEVSSTSSENLEDRKR